MGETSSSAGLPQLYGEHLVLGATFGDDAVVISYAHETPEGIASSYQATLCDLTHMQVLYFAGLDAPAFAQAAFAQSPLSVGSCSFGAVLTGDGNVASIPLLARTGKQEYVALDPSPRADVLSAWLSFLSNVSSDGYAPYAHMQTQDVTATHVVLLLQGQAAPRVLEDYLGNQHLPGTGCVASVLLDRIPCVVLNTGDRVLPVFLIMVPPHAAVALWRSLLSFTEVTPVGTEAFSRMAARRHPWYDKLCHAGSSLSLPAKDLTRWGLVRNTDDYVGARALRSRTEV